MSSPAVCFEKKVVVEKKSGNLKKSTRAGLSSWCLLIVVWLFLTVPWGCLRFVIVVVPDHTHLLLQLQIC